MFSPSAIAKREIGYVVVVALVCALLYLAVPLIANEEYDEDAQQQELTLWTPGSHLANLTSKYNSLLKEHREALHELHAQRHEALKFKHEAVSPEFHFYDDSKCPSPKLAVASMTRHNSINSMSAWIDYYFNIGFCHVFLRIQHSEYLRYMIQFPKYKGRISPIWIDDWPMTLVSNATKDELRKFNTSKRDWQTTFVDKVIKVSLEYKLDWLLQVDDDELMYLFNKEPANKFVEKQDDVIQDVHFKNTESIVAPPTINKEYPPFQYTRSQTQVEPLPTGSDYALHRFQNPLHYKTGKGAYGNGKSIGRVSPVLTTNGVHFFSTTTCRQDDSCKKVSYEPNREEAAILHYECPDFMEWVSKFGKYRTADLKHIPFGYYRQSVKAIRDTMEWYNSQTTVSDKLKAQLEMDDSKGTIRVDIRSGHDDSFYDLVPHSYKEYKGFHDRFKSDLWDVPV